jgi:hypothetical protein
LDSIWITPEQVEDDYGFYSDLYKDEYGVRPHGQSPEQLSQWLNTTFKLDGNRIVKRELKEDDYDMGTPSGDTDAMNIAEDGSTVPSDDEVIRRTVEGFDLKFVPEAFRNAYTTKKDRPSPALARRINTWIEKNFPYSLIRVAFEGVYRTVNFYRQNTK